MTSNFGSKKLSLLPEGVSSSKVKNEILLDLRNHFSPEFINRIDDIILFNKLSKKNIKNILDIQLKTISEMLLTNKKITLIVEERAKRW
jgi:ATP-dependent Clp protease ATP-binding subunit ClpB